MDEENSPLILREGGTGLPAATGLQSLLARSLTRESECRKTRFLGYYKPRILRRPCRRSQTTRSASLVQRFWPPT